MQNTLIDEIARIIQPELFSTPEELKDDAYRRFVESTRAKARDIIALVKTNSRVDA